jgi:acetylornithine/succinyldiaminopimelate/putrescine aminotransferase
MNGADLGDKKRAMALFGRHVSTGKLAFFHQAGIEFVLGARDGPYLWDIEGEKRLIDCHCNGGVFNLGHRNREIRSALEAGLDSLDIGNHHLISAYRARLAAELARLTPPEIQYTVFGVGGGEAVDLAIKVARAYSGRSNIVSMQGGYHGHTGLALAAGDEKYRVPFRSTMPEFRQVAFNDLDALAQSVDENCAAVILETIPATSGMPMPEPGYLAGVQQLCRSKGALLILDEVQAGLGRTGRLWAFEHDDVTPDILVIGKGLSGGYYPISATCFGAKLETVFHEDPFAHVSTFGGSELGCAVGLKVLELSSSAPFLSHVEAMGEYFRQGFQRLRREHPALLVGLRQRGLMMGIELADPAMGPLFTKLAYERGILSVYANNEPRICQLLPPLTIDRPLAGEIMDRIGGALGGVAAFLN